MTVFDYAAGLLLLVSGLVGFARGATREITTVVALIVSAALAIICLKFSGPIAHKAIHTLWLANAAAILAVFVLAYIVLRLLGGALTQGVRQTALSGLDRTIGFAIGLARAVLVLGVFVLLIQAATPPERMPRWITSALLFPLSSTAAKGLRAFAPEGMKVAHQVAPALAHAVSGDNAGPTSKTSDRKSHRGWDPAPDHAEEDSP